MTPARRALGAAAVALATALSLTPTAPAMPSGSDLAAHLAMHAGLAWALLRAWPKGTVAAAAALALAVGLELGQHFVPGRFLSAGDMAMNLLGVALGAAAAGLRLPTGRA